MFDKVNWRSTLKTALIGAALFAVPVFMYIQMASYSDTWLLFLGNFLFFGVMGVHTYLENNKRGNNESTIALIFSSSVTTVLGIVLASVISLLLLILFLPGFIGTGEAKRVLTEVPANSIVDKTGGMSLKILMSATFINFCVGSFSGLLLAFYSKQNQTRDSRRPTPFHQKGSR